MVALFALGGFLVQQPTAATFRAINHSSKTLCAESDNVTVALSGNSVLSFDIDVTHPDYAYTLDNRNPDFRNCPSQGGQDYPFPQPFDRKVYDDGINVVVCQRHPQWWLNQTMTVSIKGTQIKVSGVHLFKLHEKISGANSWPEVIVAYQDGNMRAIPFPPVGKDSVAFGSSFQIGPILSDRPVAAVENLEFDPATREVTLQYGDGGSATLAITELTRELLRLNVRPSFDTAAKPFFVIRSMIVAEGNADVDSIRYRNVDSSWSDRVPVLDFNDVNAGEIEFYRAVPSNHNTSAPDYLIRNVKTAASNNSGLAAVITNIVTIPTELDNHFLGAVNAGGFAALAAAAGPCNGGTNCKSGNIYFARYTKTGWERIVQSPPHDLINGSATIRIVPNSSNLVYVSHSDTWCVHFGHLSGAAFDIVEDQGAPVPLPPEPAGVSIDSISPDGSQVLVRTWSNIAESRDKFYLASPGALLPLSGPWATSTLSLHWVGTNIHWIAGFGDVHLGKVDALTGKFDETHTVSTRALSVTSQGFWSASEDGRKLEKRSFEFQLLESFLIPEPYRFRDFQLFEVTDEARFIRVVDQSQNQWTFFLRFRNGAVDYVVPTTSVDPLIAVSPDGRFLAGAYHLIDADSGATLSLNWGLVNQQPNTGVTFIEADGRLFLCRANFYEDDLVIAEIIPGSRLAGEGDLNGDSFTDLLFESADGEKGYWSMKGENIQFGASFTPGTTYDTAWRLIGYGDLNGDKQPDLVFQYTDGSLAAWLMHGATLFTPTRFGPTSAAWSTGPDWNLTGVRDVNRDGNPDLLFQHKDGWLAAWFMKGTNLVTAIQLTPNHPGQGWNVIGTGDFYGDGNWELAFQNDDGTLGIWEMDGVNLVAPHLLNPFHPGRGWRAIGVADLDLDGRSDLLLEYDGDGSMGVWFMDGHTLIRPAMFTPSYAAGTWKLVGPK